MNRKAAVALVLWSLGALAAAAGADPSKLDPRVRAALGRARGGATVEAMQASGVGVSRAGELDVFIVGTATRAELEARGARIRTALPGFFTAYLPPSAVEAVASLPGVSAIRGSAPVEIELDASVPTTGAAAVRGPGPAFAGVNGAGVLVGDVDSGIDYDHGDFKDAGGLTRLVSIWDQTVAGVAPLPYGYGNECTPAQINAGTCSQVDTDGHGTHVLGIAGGDGSQTGGTTPAHTYAGMAPLADLCMVKTNFQTTGVVDGVQYIFDQATARGQNAVVNLSLGSHFGPHDGTSPFESALSAMTGPGRIICKSAGNERGLARHAEVFAAGSGTSATLSVSGGASSATITRTVAFDGYYESTENLSVRITTPNGTVIGPVPLGSMNAAFPGQPAGTNGLVYLENGVSTSGGGDPQVYIELNALAGSGATLTGTWTFTFIPVSLGPANGEVDLWRFFSNATSANFLTGNQNFEELISEPGNAHELITVAAWVSRQNWVACTGTLTTFTGTPAPGPLASFSSPGPTRDGRQKPDIAAPGIAILSTRSFDNPVACPASGPSTLASDGANHIANAGTSMAAPHATGASALLLQKYGAMTPAQVKAYMKANATVDGFVGTPWNKDWGQGKLNVRALTGPTVAILSPAGGARLEACTSVKIAWNAKTDAGTVTGVDIHLSRSGPAGPFEEIVSGAPNTGTYSWFVLGPPTTGAVLRLTAHDSGGGSASDLTKPMTLVLQGSSTTLAADVPKTECGGKVNLTATVGPAAATGDVHFFDGSTAVGAAPLVGGTASLSVNPAASGIHSYTAVYSGDTCYAASTSNAVEVRVNPTPTSVRLEGPAKSRCGEKATFTATVDPPTAGGDVHLLDGGDPIATATLQGGVATFSIIGLGAGGHLLRVAYKGDACYAPSTSNDLDHTVNPVATETVLQSEPNPSSCGEDVVLTATVLPATATGTVNFFDDGTPIGSGTLVNGVATMTISNLAVGLHRLTAVYKGDSCHSASASNPVAHEVVPAVREVALTVSPNPAACGQKVTLVAEVNEPSVPGLAASRAARPERVLEPSPPGGTVNFFADGRPIGSAPLVDSTATLSVTDLPVGTHSITAEYKGDTCYANAVSNKVVLTVDPLPTTLTLTSSPNPSACGEKVTLTAAVSPATATGTVTFSDGATVLGTAPVVNGVATLSVTGLAPGPHSLGAEYSGDSCHASSLADPVSHQVDAVATTITLSSDPNPSTCRDAVTLTATVAPPGASGLVNFFDGSTPIGSAPLSNGSASITLTTLASGTHTFSATYKGDSCHVASSSGPLEHVHDCPVAALLTLFQAESRDGGVELRFQFGDPSEWAETRVERAEAAAGPWTPVAAELRAEGLVTVAFDRTAAAGRSYWYRLVARPTVGAPLVFGPLAVTTGSGVREFELASIRPNPSAALTRIDFAVAREARVRLSVVDVQGREVAVLAEGVHRPGRYQAAWSGRTDRGPAPVGIYFVRYQVPGRTLTARLVIAR